MEITLTIEQLENLLTEQKRATGEYITRNLTTYQWYNENSSKIDNETAREQLASECIKSGYPNDFNVLKKYIK